MSHSSKLQGLRAVFFESRFPKAIFDLIKAQGGIPFSAPTMKEIPLEDNPEAFNFAGKLLKDEFAAVIFLTGVGAKYLIETLETRHKKDDILAALRKTFIIVRGPKPLRVMNELKVPVGIAVPEPNTWKDILQSIDDAKSLNLRGREVALQEYGISNEALIQSLEERGIVVIRVPVYRWALPDDLAPLKEAVERICYRKADIAVFTSATQVDHLLKVAREMGREEELLDGLRCLVVASIGPICSEAIRSHGFAVDFEPKTPKMGPLILELAERAPHLLRQKHASHGH